MSLGIHNSLLSSLILLALGIFVGFGKFGITFMLELKYLGSTQKKLAAFSLSQSASVTISSLSSVIIAGLI